MISSLKEAGIGAEGIEDGGGQISQAWYSAKEIGLELHVTHREMNVLLQAMANVERLFAAIRRPWFPKTKTDFSFSEPVPQFTENPQAAEESLKKAVKIAQQKAAILAQEAGLELGRVLTVVEESSLTRNHNRDSNSDLDSDFDFSRASVKTLPISPRQFTIPTCFRVRFAVDDVAN